MNGSSIPKLISSELAMLWNTYVADTAAVCCIKHYIKTNEDPDVLPVLKYALSIAQDHIDDIASLFKKKNFQYLMDLMKQTCTMTLPNYFQT